MKTKFFLKNTLAVAGVIEFLLLVGLFAIVLATIQTLYVPEIMEQKEADHMDEISNQFSRLKAMIDIQTEEKSSIPLSSVFTLGNKELPYFVTLSKSGSISIIDKEDTMSNIKFDTSSSSEIFDLTSIKYDANNFYFVPQTYVYQGGGVIIKQPEGLAIMWLEPPMNATPIRNQYGDVTDIEVYFDIPIILCDSENSNIAGLENCFIQTNYSNELSDQNWNYLSNILSINITTEYPNAWYEYFNSSDKDVKNNVTINKGSNYAVIEKASKDINLYYRKTCIFARIEYGG